MTWEPTSVRRSTPRRRTTTAGRIGDARLVTPQSRLRSRSSRSCCAEVPRPILRRSGSRSTRRPEPGAIVGSIGLQRARWKWPPAEAPSTSMRTVHLPLRVAVGRDKAPEGRFVHVGHRPAVPDLPLADVASISLDVSQQTPVLITNVLRTGLEIT